MPVHDDLGTRMKEFYEGVPKTRLMRRTPVAIRIDGKAFHTLTRGFQKPFDPVLMDAMQRTMKYLCKNIEGCKFGYSQSDEITLILIDYQKFTSGAWFDYEVQKIASISASMATMAFNKYFTENVEKYNAGVYPYEKGNGIQANTYLAAVDKGACFDARCFNIPKEEVANLIYWRQLDATRNSIQMVGQAYFSHKELQNKSCNDIQNMLLTQKDINWNSFPTDCKRGAACIKTTKEVMTMNFSSDFDKPLRSPLTSGTLTFSGWEIDKEMPILKEDWNYINQFIYVGEE